MEVVEIVLYIGVAIFIGIIGLGVITGWDFDAFGSNIKKLFGKDTEEISFEKVNEHEFVSRVNDVFSKCKTFGENMTQSYYVSGEGTMTKEGFFKLVKSVGWCDSIQSEEFSCGAEEDVVMQDVILPAMVRVNCTNEKLRIS